MGLHVLLRPGEVLVGDTFDVYQFDTMCVDSADLTPEAVGHRHTVIRSEGNRLPSRERLFRDHRTRNMLRVFSFEENQLWFGQYPCDLIGGLAAIRSNSCLYLVHKISPLCKM